MRMEPSTLGHIGKSLGHRPVVTAVQVHRWHRTAAVSGQSAPPSISPHRRTRLSDLTKAEFRWDGHSLTFGAACDDMDCSIHSSLLTKHAVHVYIVPCAHIQSFVICTATSLSVSCRRHSSLANALWLWMLS
jgi:hypothetical protein